MSQAYLLHLRSKHNASEDDRVLVRSILRYSSRCISDASLSSHHGSFGLAEPFHLEDMIQMNGPAIVTVARSPGAQEISTRGMVNGGLGSATREA